MPYEPSAIMLTDTPFRLRDRTVRRVSPGLLLRDDKRLGRYQWRLHALPVNFTEFEHDPDAVRDLPVDFYPDVIWYTLGQLAQLTQVPKDVLVQRMKEKWPWPDMRKPVGWERVREAKAHGVEYDGQVRSLYEVAKLTGRPYTTLIQRLARGLPLDAVTAPGRPRRQTVEDPSALPPGALRTPFAPDAPDGSAVLRPHVRFLFDGAVDTLAGHCKVHGVSVQTVRYRLGKGCTLARAFDSTRLPRSDKGVPNPARGARYSRGA